MIEFDPDREEVFLREGDDVAGQQRRELYVPPGEEVIYRDAGDGSEAEVVEEVDGGLVDAVWQRLASRFDVVDTFEYTESGEVTYEGRDAVSLEVSNTGPVDRDVVEIGSGDRVDVYLNEGSLVVGEAYGAFLSAEYDQNFDDVRIVRRMGFTDVGAVDVQRPDWME